MSSRLPVEEALRRAAARRAARPSVPLSAAQLRVQAQERAMDESNRALGAEWGMGSPVRDEASDSESTIPYSPHLPPPAAESDDDIADELEAIINRMDELDEDIADELEEAIRGMDAAEDAAMNRRIAARFAELDERRDLAMVNKIAARFGELDAGDAAMSRRIAARFAELDARRAGRDEVPMDMESYEDEAIRRDIIRRFAELDERREAAIQKRIADRFKELDDRRMVKRIREQFEETDRRKKKRKKKGKKIGSGGMIVGGGPIGGGGGPIGGGGGPIGGGGGGGIPPAPPVPPIPVPIGGVVPGTDLVDLIGWQPQWHSPTWNYMDFMFVGGDADPSQADNFGREIYYRLWQRMQHLHTTDMQVFALMVRIYARFAPGAPFMWRTLDLGYWMAPEFRDPAEQANLEAEIAYRLWARLEQAGENYGTDIVITQFNYVMTNIMYDIRGGCDQRQKGGTRVFEGHLLRSVKSKDNECGMAIVLQFMRKHRSRFPPALFKEKLGAKGSIRRMRTVCFAQFPELRDKRGWEAKHLNYIPSLFDVSLVIYSWKLLDGPPIYGKENAKGLATLRMVYCDPGSKLTDGDTSVGHWLWLEDKYV